MSFSLEKFLLPGKWVLFLLIACLMAPSLGVLGGRDAAASGYLCVSADGPSLSALAWLKQQNLPSDPSEKESAKHCLLCWQSQYASAVFERAFSDLQLSVLSFVWKPVFAELLFLPFVRTEGHPRAPPFFSLAVI